MPDAIPSLSELFTGDHRGCDAQWAEVESAADGGSPEDTEAGWSRFEQALRRHLAIEEEILFPAFEQVTGMTDGGPTFVMRAEHAQMRGLLDQMGQALGAGDHDKLLDLGDTLLLLIAQHNQKEERMLYPMAERALGAQWTELAQRIDAF